MPYKPSDEYMSWTECRRLCPTGAIKQTNGHYWIDLKLCDRCQGLPEYLCGGIFHNNSPNQLQDFNAYWREWFAHYQKLRQRLETGAGK